MLKTKKAKRLLSKWEQGHLTAVGINRVEDFDEKLARMAKEQADLEAKHGKDIPVFIGWCPTCWAIGEKLNMI